MQNISIDIIETEDIQESLDELDVPVPNLYMKPFGVGYRLEELIKFHLDLWKEGKTKGAFTCLNSVYQALTIVMEKVKSSYFKDEQIGVEIFEFDQYQLLTDKTHSHVQLQQEELKIRKTLLDFCGKLDGSFLETDNGRYQIFSTRAAIEWEMALLQLTVQQLTLDTGVPVAVGTGFGETASSAETNAYTAVKHSKEKPGHGYTIVEEDGVISPRKECCKQELKERLGEEVYHCPIPEDVMPISSEKAALASK